MTQVTRMVAALGSKYGGNVSYPRRLCTLTFLSLLVLCCTSAACQSPRVRLPASPHAASPGRELAGTYSLHSIQHYQIGSMRHKTFSWTFRGLDGAPSGTFSRLVRARKLVLSGGQGESPVWTTMATVVLQLKADGSAKWRSDYHLGGGAVVLNGKWSVVERDIALAFEIPRAHESGPPDIEPKFLKATMFPSGPFWKRVEMQSMPSSAEGRFLFVEAKWAPEPEIVFQIVLKRASGGEQK